MAMRRCICALSVPSQKSFQQQQQKNTWLRTDALLLREASTTLPPHTAPGVRAAAPHTPLAPGSYGPSPTYLGRWAGRRAHTRLTRGTHLKFFRRLNFDFRAFRGVGAGEAHGVARRAHHRRRAAVLPVAVRGARRAARALQPEHAAAGAHSRYWLCADEGVGARLSPTAALCQAVERWRPSPTTALFQTIKRWHEALYVSGALDREC